MITNGEEASGLNEAGVQGEDTKVHSLQDDEDGVQAFELTDSRVRRQKLLGGDRAAESGLL